VFDYGNEQACMVGLQDVPPATDTALVGNADVRRIPANLDQVVGSGAALTTARNALENFNIPGTWIQATNTWREVVRFAGACCQFARRYQGLVIGGLWFTGGVTLDSTFASLPAAARQGIIDAAASFDFDTSGFTGSSTLRTIITSAANQFLAAGYPLELQGAL
jgi:hypothetical protein